MMAANDPKLVASSGTDLVTVSDWLACFNKNDNTIVLSCIVKTGDATASITGVGLILNDEKGNILASFYTAFSNGCESVEPSLNLPPGGLHEGATVYGVASGEVHGQHFFFEEQLTIDHCSDV